MSKTFQTILGVLLIAAGVAALFMLPDRSAWVALALVGLGGFFVSQSKMVEFGKAAAEFVRGIRS